MISLILTMSSVFYILLYAIKSSKREFISYKMKRGHCCYSCKSDIEDEYFYGEEEKYKLCKSCHREEQLNSVLKKPFINKRFIITNKFNKIGLIFNIISTVFNILSISIWKPFAILGSLSLFIGMTIFYIHYMATTRKKQS